MAQTLTDRTKSIKNTPGTGELVQIAEINSAFDKFDNHFVPAAAIVRVAATQAIVTATDTAIDFDTTRHDSYAARSEGAMADLVNNRIQIRKAGLYLITAKAAYAGNATGNRSLKVMLNGVQLIETGSTSPGAGGAQDLSVAYTDVLAVNDLVSVNVRQTSGANLDLIPNGGADGISLSVSWLGTVVEI